MTQTQGGSRDATTDEQRRQRVHGRNGIWYLHLDPKQGRVVHDFMPLQKLGVVLRTVMAGGKQALTRRCTWFRGREVTSECRLSTAQRTGKRW